MSRWIEQKNGKVIETIADMDQCMFLWNQICCNDKCEMFTFSPMEGECERCSCFIEEDGNVKDE